MKEVPMKFTFLKSIAVTAALFISSLSVANAGLYLNDDIEVSALSLTEDFVSFYDYQGHGKRTYSSNTGYEQGNTIVMFLAEYNSQLALITLVDAYKSNGKGTAKVTIDNLSDFGSVLFKDDANDKLSANGVDWKWAHRKNDGMVLQLLDPSNFTLDINFSNLTGLSGGIKFLSFSDQGVTEHVVGNDLRVQVPEPTTLAIFSLAILGFASRRFTK